jgi:hypothetical protein
MPSIRDIAISIEKADLTASRAGRSVGDAGSKDAGARGPFRHGCNILTVKSFSVIWSMAKLRPESTVDLPHYLPLHRRQLFRRGSSGAAWLARTHWGVLM